MIFFKSILEKGKILLKTGKADEAIRLFSTMVSDKPENAQFRFYLAKAYFQKNDLIKTKENLLKCIKFNPNEEVVKNIAEITNFKKVSSDRYYNTFLNFSSDGKKIVFVSIRRDTNNDGLINNLDNGGIYIIDSDGKNEKLIVEDKYANSDCSFSPDGKYITYLSRRRDTNGDGKIDNKDSAGIYIYSLETGEEQFLITDETFNKKPAFLPDNKSVYFCSWRGIGGNSGIYSVDIKTKVISGLISDMYENTSPCISSNGQYVVYSSWREDTNKDGKIDFKDSSAIYITDIKKRTTTRLTGDKYNNSFPDFSFDNKNIVYLSRRRDTNKDGRIDSLDFCGIYIITIGDKKLQEIVSDKFYNKYPSFTSNGESIVFLGSLKGKSRNKDAEIRDIFENKGIYSINIKNKKMDILVSSNYFSSSFPKLSSSDKVAYLSWRKHTRRGIFIRDIYKLPTLAELKEIIEENL
ncbi:MAG: DPP IV N-terminal domain-containing protein [Elusimicrobia bacterium]|nr:DPP IV N-terminal domain-containing protein [Elusimicrobiota bacterium]